MTNAIRAGINRGVMYTMHQDTPVVPPDMLLTIWAAVDVAPRMGPISVRQRISVWEALRGVTINAAYQYFEEKEKGGV